jgi:hypothetical protein
MGWIFLATKIVHFIYNFRKGSRPLQKLEQFLLEAIKNTNIFQFFIEYLESKIQEENLSLNWDLINILYKVNHDKLINAINSQVKNLRIKNINENCLRIYLLGLRLTLESEFNTTFISLKKNKNLNIIELILTEDYYESMEIRDSNYIDSLKQLTITSKSSFGIDENIMGQISELKNIQNLNITSSADLYLEFNDAGERVTNLEVIQLSTTQVLSSQALEDVLGVPKLKKLILNIREKNKQLDYFIKTANMMISNLEIEINIGE